MGTVDILKTLLIPAVLSALMVPLAIKLCHLWRFYDHSNVRKVHQGRKPCLGGLAIFTAFTASSLALLPADYPLLIVLGGGVFFFTLGVLDDWRHISPRVKFVMEFAFTTLLVVLGINSGLLMENPFGSIAAGSFLVWLAVPFYVLWIVGVANAVNLVDGLDALASGVVLIAGGMMVVAAFVSPVVALNPLLLVLLGSLLGYIGFNLYPSRIIMGDNGSLFVGYAIAIISLSSFSIAERSIFLSVVPAAMALFVPIFDTLATIIRRSIRGKRIFSADNNHIHHFLLQKGHSHPRAVKIIWAFSFGFGALSVLLSRVIFRQSYLALVLLAMTFLWALYYAVILGLFSQQYSDDSIDRGLFPVKGDDDNVHPPDKPQA